ncbi:MAG TPA: adenylate/guanylate cyclase domain-containing protein [Solirubrobacteraceae bacterium]
MSGDRPERLTFWQRAGARSLARSARKRPGEPLGSEDWAAYWQFGAQPTNRAIKRVLRSLPSSPRCGFCGAPFSGAGSRLVRPLGYRPSRKNPNLCAACVELAPPGGMTLEAGVVFADLRGFTTLSEHAAPEQTSALLRRFYSCAEKTFFPEALIDKVIGDEVMALYVPPFMFPDILSLTDEQRRELAATMLRHAHALMQRVGYGSPEGPFVEMGIGLDFGEVFIGNIGDEAVHDFTAIGDVVNTAARLQGHAAGGEAVLSARLAAHLDEPLGAAEQLVLKGKAQPLAAHRISWRG